MKYRTVIEILCDASDKEEATNLAGEYLKGEINFGVSMKCKSAPLWAHRTKKYTASLIVMVLLLSTFAIQFVPVSENGKTSTKISSRLSSTYTVMPALKTKEQEDFKKEWEKKKDEAVLDYIKN